MYGANSRERSHIKTLTNLKGNNWLIKRFNLEKQGCSHLVDTSVLEKFIQNFQIFRISILDPEKSLLYLIGTLLYLIGTPHPLI